MDAVLLQLTHLCVSVGFDTYKLCAVSCSVSGIDESRNLHVEHAECVSQNIKEEPMDSDTSQCETAAPSEGESHFPSNLDSLTGADIDRYSEVLSTA